MVYRIQGKSSAVSQFRQDPVTDEWIIVAPERALKAEQFVNIEKRPKLPAHDPNCVFCTGNEYRTPPEVFAIREEGTLPDTPGWLLRVIPNKFPAVTPEGSTNRRVDRIYRSMDGLGHHEVVDETPMHDFTLGTMPIQTVERIIRVYRERYMELMKDNRIAMVIIFRNQGEKAGASQPHPHSQIIAIPIVPLWVRNRTDRARYYYDENGKCIFCKILFEELMESERVVIDESSFLVFEPYASKGPFETWILPKRHSASFGSITDEEVAELSGVVSRLMKKFHEGLGDPDYNLIIHSAPKEDAYAPYYHWYIELRPHLTTPAGFEMGSGIYINIALPEKTAAILREIK